MKVTSACRQCNNSNGPGGYLRNRHLGALIGAGIPEDRAAAYDRGLKEGGIVIGTRARDDKHAAELERDFSTYGGTDVYR